MVEMIKDLATDWPMGTIIFILVLIVLLGVLFFILDYVLGTTVQRSGIVIEKSYTASSTGTGIGPSTGGSGGVAVVVTSNPEKYILFVREVTGNVDKVEVDMETWLQNKVGDKHVYHVRIGRFTGC